VLRVFAHGLVARGIRGLAGGLGFRSHSIHSVFRVPASASAVACGGFLVVLLAGPRGILAQKGPSVTAAAALGTGIRSLGFALLGAVARSARVRIVRQLDH